MSAHNCHKRKRLHGQAATELAVFGAILIFLIGAIVRTSISSSYQQNQQLKAMRYALLQSYKSSQAQAAGRNSATVLYIEDRLSPDLLKYGPSDRQPAIAQGSGTMTNMLMYPLDWTHDLIGPDGRPNINNIPVMDIYINGKHFVFATAWPSTKTLSPPTDAAGTPYNVWYANNSFPDPNGNGTNHYHGWNFACGVPGQQGGVDGQYGCPIFYQMSITSGDYGNLSEQEAYDLNRDDDFTNDPLPSNRTNMSWHWKGTNGLDANVKVDAANNNYPSFDVDNDGQEETIYAALSPQGVISSVSVFDFQDGDLDMSRDVYINGRRVGLQNDMAIYTRTEQGTYLQIKEGKLYNPETGLVVRSASFRDQGEIVQRIIQLSNDTGRMCSSTGSPIAPVETCGNCFLPSNVKSTCFDPGKKMLFVRSRLLDKAGHKWKTDVGGGLP